MYSLSIVHDIFGPRLSLGDKPCHHRVWNINLVAVRCILRRSVHHIAACLSEHESLNPPIVRPRRRQITTIFETFEFRVQFLYKRPRPCTNGIDPRLKLETFSRLTF